VLRVIRKLDEYKMDINNLKPTPEMIAEAKNNPNGCVYAIDRNYGLDDDAPPWAIIGAWEVDSKGEIVTDSFQNNPKYKPSI
jgi:hypothetical protein